ncbi:MAG: hypothetical protein IJN09_07205 [Oscillospiraceae bacterium]|nr:hypothetical protein [Oscillospiraceae bacterium]MBQ7120170.1 hypothetical protein [Oscillospiraceae bacterium]
MIRIYTDKKEKDLKNFWGHIVFHPTNAIEDDWGKEQLNKISEDGAAKTIRIYSMFEDMVTLNEKGEMVFDFSKNDARIDYLLEKGFTPHISYGFFPLWLAAEKEDGFIKKRYKGADFSVSYPYDYSKWEEICRTYTKHIIDRYGEAVVTTWRVHCYNEPDSWAFFHKSAESRYARVEEYFKLYEAFVRGVTSVCDKIRVGAPGLAENPRCHEFFCDFLGLVRENNTRLDFITFHAYGTTGSHLKEEKEVFDSRGALHQILDIMRLAKMYGFDDIPFMVDEWGASTGGYDGIDKNPAYDFRENEKYAAYYVRMLTLFDELNLPIEQMMICLSGQHDLSVDFGGHRNFFSKSFYPKPIYNAHVLANKLGDEKLHYYTERDHDEFVSVLPSKHSKDGHMSVLLCYADDAFSAKRCASDFDIRFSNLDREYNVVKYVIDKTHANVYTKFLELGSPQNASPEIQNQIRDAGALVSEKCGCVSPQNEIITLNMAENSVLLLELLPIE